MAVVRGESKGLKHKLRTKQKKRLLYDDIYGESLIGAIWVQIIFFMFVFVTSILPELQFSDLDAAPNNGEKETEDYEASRTKDC